MNLSQSVNNQSHPGEQRMNSAMVNLQWTSVFPELVSNRAAMTGLRKDIVETNSEGQRIALFSGKHEQFLRRQ